MEFLQFIEMERNNTPTNPSLIVRFVNNMDDDEVAKEFVGKYKPILRSYLRTYLLDNENIEDLLQDIFIKILVYLKKFKHQGTGSFRAWLKTVVHSVYSDWIEDLIKQNQLKEDLIKKLQESIQHLPERIALEYDLEIMKVATHRIRLEIDPRTWEIFEMFKIQNNQAEVVAAKFQVATRTVYGIGFRVMARLREMVIYLDKMKKKNGD